MLSAFVRGIEPVACRLDGLLALNAGVHPSVSGAGVVSGFLAARTGMSENEAYPCLSAAGDFSVSQVVDVVEGVHCTIRQRDLA
ncbi:hypothetical protein ACWFR5_17990 [Streptomyces sp. NPDC055092]